MKLTCQFCNKPCSDILLYLNRYAHVGCAETDFFYRFPRMETRWYEWQYQTRLEFLRDHSLAIE